MIINVYVQFCKAINITYMIAAINPFDHAYKGGYKGAYKCTYIHNLFDVAY